MTQWTSAMFTQCAESVPILRYARISVPAAALAFVCALIAGCGGGGAEGEHVPAASGRIFPAVPGLVFVEYDADGIALQTSTVTDGEGRFSFGRALVGVRVEGVDGSIAASSAPRVYSAPVTERQTALEVTAVSTLYDFARLQSADASAARTWLGRVIGDACGIDVLVELGRAMTGDPGYSSPARTRVLLATHAYLTGLSRSGHSPTGLLQAWLDRVEGHAASLGSLCQLAAQVLAPAWLTQTMGLFATRGRPVDAATLSWLSQHRDALLRQGLELRSQDVLAREFGDELAQRLFDISYWRGREPVLLQELAFASYEMRRSLGQQHFAGVAYVLEPDGRIRHRLDAGQLAGASQVERVVISNGSQRTVRFELAVNGRRLTDKTQLLWDIMAAPPSNAGEPLHRRAWRHMVALSRHSYPLSENLFVHQPDLFLRSIGTGFCDDMSSALHWIWRELGMEARVVGLGGHVVAEVRVGDRWEMYDPDYGVYMLNGAGFVASVSDLELDQAPLSAPAESLRGYPHVRNLAELYASVDDNLVSTFYSRDFPDPVDGVVSLPPGSSLEVDSMATQNVAAVGDAEMLRFGRMTIRLPPGFSGVLLLPAVVSNIEGTGAVVDILGEEHVVGEAGLQEVILARYRAPEPPPDTAITRLDVRDSGASGLLVTMLLNEALLAADGSLRVSLFGEDLTGVTSSTTLALRSR